MAIKVTAIINTKADGTKVQGQNWTARDEAHADRIIARRKAALPAGSSTYFIRESA